MTFPNLIGISGKIGSGKTTIANELLKTYPTYERKAYGDILKIERSKTYRFPLAWCYSTDGKSNIVNPPTRVGILLKLIGFHERHLLPRHNMIVREVLQWHGTDYRRAQHENYWVNQMESFISQQANKYIIIDDVRFPNELNSIHQMGGVVIRLNPHSHWNSGIYATHHSECALDDSTSFDLVIKPKYNNVEGTVRNIISLLDVMRR